MGVPYIKKRSRKVLLIEEMARVYNIHAFFIFNWLEANGVKYAKVKGKPFHAVNAKIFCESIRDIIYAASKVRDDRNTRTDPERIPTVENMLYRDKDKKRVGPYENGDIERPIYPSKNTELNRNGIEVSMLYRVNMYCDGSRSLDVLDRRTLTWKMIEGPEKWKCKDILDDWKVMYNLDC
nr:MAG: hypothetical protein [Bacteriophage sp.]